jgi:hypothetical protein
VGRLLYCASASRHSRNPEEIDAKKRKKEVDEHRETLHNLASLLLTNKTIRKRSKAVPNTKLFNNKQSISVGV